MKNQPFKKSLEFFKSRNDKQFSKASKELTLDGHIDGWDGRVLRGWASWSETNDNVQLELLINGNHMAFVPANKFRKDLVEAGRVEDGNAGFEYEVNIHHLYEILNKSTENTFQVIDTQSGLELLGSPFYFKNPAVIGSVDLINNKSLQGWAYDRNYQTNDLELDLYVNKKFKCKAVADNERLDLLDAGHLKVNSGFLFDLSNYILSNEFAKIELKISGTDINIIAQEFKLEPFAGKIQALTHLQRLVRESMELEEYGQELDWLNGNVLPSVIDHFRLKEESTLFGNSSTENIERCCENNEIIDIIVPVYDGIIETINCINSIVLAKGNQSFELIVINDKSPNDTLSDELVASSKKHGFTLLENDQNKGFISTVNRGMKLHPDRDVLLLNSDTIVPDYWLEQIAKTAYSSVSIGTVTPFSNNATICSFPRFCVDNEMPKDISTSDLNLVFNKVNKGKVIDLPTAHGFCMFIKRCVMNEIGFFDDAKYGKGYAEENDFSLRANRRGWRNVLAADTFVHHIGSVSFSENSKVFIENNLKILNKNYPDYPVSIESFVRKDPIRTLRNDVVLELLSQEVFSVKQNELAPGKTILFLSLSFAGGTKKATDELAGLLAKEGQAVFMLSSPQKGIWELTSHTTNVIMQYHWPEEYSKLLSDLKLLDVWHLHFHNTLQFPKDIWNLPKDLGVAYDVTIHDYHSICPRVNLVDDTNSYCGEPPSKGCDNCIVNNGVHDSSLLTLNDFGGTIIQWRKFHLNVLRDARRVITPSLDTKERILKYIPLVNIEAQYHPENRKAVDLVRANDEDVTNVTFIGAIGEHKGFNLLVGCAKYALKFELPLRFIVIGYTCNDELLVDLPNVTVTGEYKCSELPYLIQTYNCHIAALFSVWPETFSYTLSESIMNGLIPMFFDIGAIPERLDLPELQFSLNATPQQICMRMLDKTISFNKKVNVGTDYNCILSDYYHLF